MSNHRVLAAAAVLMLATTTPSGRTKETPDWPQWRGPRRDGSAPSLSVPASWPAELSRKWSVDIGEGHAGPVVASGRIIVHVRENDREVVRALALEDGAKVWERSWPVGYQMHPAATGHGKGPKATPAVSRGTVFVLGIDGTMTALDEKTGAVRWRKEFTGKFKTASPAYGAAASPLVEKSLVIAPFGGHHDGMLAALDVASGAVRWSLEGDGPGYASPVAADLSGRRQIITQTDRRIVGLAAESGKLLWSLPLVTPYDQNVVTPLVFEDLVIVSGLEYGLRAFRLHPQGDALEPKEVWNSPEASLYMSSPVVAGGRLFGLSHLKSGQIVCLDPRTGKLLWTGPGSQGEYATFTAAPGAVLALTEGAEMFVLSTKAGAFEPLARYKVADSPTWAHPAPAPGGLLVKDKTRLTFWKIGAETPPPPRPKS
ncbi:MAG TPA: PQQ-binding-like beta-propeller repeat protein [Candidatus Polarisedimenticolia bacterium]|nr:PQQ-binding-like beta-propeller repeat protein [Candidatus Polarisedimenticolia bacterium]